MKKIAVVLLFILWLAAPSTILADECMEGDCDNGVGTGFTDNNLIYEGEWQDGLPHGKGKLYKGKGQVVEGVWEKGKLIKANNVNEEKEILTEE